MTNITYGTFFLFGTSIVIGIVVVLLFMPETKGLSLEEMDILFHVSGFANTQRAKADDIIKEMRQAEELVGADVKADAATYVEEV